MPPRHRLSPAILSPVILLLGLLHGQAAAQPVARTAPSVADATRLATGSIALVEPDIRLFEVTAGGLSEPREAWTQDARRLYAEAARAALARTGATLAPDFDIPDDLPPDSRLGQVLRLNEAVALSIRQFLTPGNVLATKRDARGQPRLDWTLGPGVAELRAATGADYALFSYIRDSYASGGRTALRVLGILAGAAVGTGLDIGGGAQTGVAMLVDLRSGEVIWFNQLTRQRGDLRDAEGARETVQHLLDGLPR